jgi:hypothetical protein
MKTPITVAAPAGPPAHPLSLDPYAPSLPAHAPGCNDPHPLALDPYSPIFPRRDPLTEER